MGGGVLALGIVGLGQGGPGARGRRTGERQALEEGRDNFLVEPRPADMWVSPAAELQEPQNLEGWPSKADPGVGSSSAVQR